VESLPFRKDEEVTIEFDSVSCESFFTCERQAQLVDLGFLCWNSGEISEANRCHPTFSPLFL
jgi:hypothetical protein